MGSAVAVLIQMDHPSKTMWPRPSEESHEENHHHFRTETVVADGGDVAVYAVKGSPSDAIASGLNYQIRGEDR